MDKKPYDKDLSYRDDPSIGEIFAEGIHQITVSKSTLRLVLSVSRAELPRGNKTNISGYKTTAARLGSGPIIRIHDGIEM